LSEILVNCELFEGLEQAAASRLARIARPQSLRQGEYLFLLGDHADRIYVVMKGKLEVCFPFSIGGRMKDVCVETTSPGHALGWSAFVKPYRFTMSARAAESSEVAGLLHKDLMQVFESEPRVGQTFIHRVAEMMGHRLLTMQALWARELQRAMAGGWPESPHAAR
jgi:CRP-like cAMP-binding protein